MINILAVGLKLLYKNKTHLEIHNEHTIILSISFSVPDTVGRSQVLEMYILAERTSAPDFYVFFAFSFLPSGNEEKIQLKAHNCEVSRPVGFFRSNIYFQYLNIFNF